MTQAARAIGWRILLAFSIGLMAVTGFAQSLEIIDLRNRTAQELLPALQPLVAPGGAITGQDYKLFVRTTSTNLADIRRAVAQLDRAPRQLLVSVRRAARQQIEREGVAIQGTLSTQGAQGSLRAEDKASQHSSDGVTSIAVLEGNSASIDNGASVPIVTAVIIGGGRRPQIGAQTQYRELPNGFIVTPRINGERVVLDVSQRTDSLRDGTIATQSLQTQASGRLGEWVALGGLEESSTSTQRGSGSRQYSTSSDQRSLWIKVELQ
jgi:type II secretory pathway component GspD/PulD (secretin)